MTRTFVGSLVPVVVAAALALAPTVDGVGGTPRCFGKPATIKGDNGDNLTGLDGTNGPDVIVALGGADMADGKGGRDRICGGEGDDAGLVGGKGNDLISAGSGFDYVVGDEASGVGDAQGGGNDRILGGSGPDQIFADAVTQAGIASGVGDDVVRGGGGDDYYLVGDNYSQTGTATGARGDDVVSGGAGNEGGTYGLWGDNFSLSGTYEKGGKDSVKGGSGDDDMDGGPSAIAAPEGRDGRHRAQLREDDRGPVGIEAAVDWARPVDPLGSGRTCIGARLWRICRL